jgi:hypothetical protein
MQGVAFLLLKSILAIFFWNIVCLWYGLLGGHKLGGVMKIGMVHVCTMGLLLSHCAAQAAFFSYRWEKNLNNDNKFKLIFSWEEGVLVTYQGKTYPVSGGLIMYDFPKKTGGVGLGSKNITSVKEDTVWLSKTIRPEDDFEKRFIYIFNPAFKNLETANGNSFFDGYSVKGNERYQYELLQNFLKKKFPGLEIKLQDTSWMDWAKRKWHYILGAIGIAGAGYATYKYYQTK